MKSIVVVDNNWGIGRQGQLLFRLPKDLAYFKERTLGKVVVMGHNTLLSLPSGKPLPNRKTIVVTQIFKSTDTFTAVYDLDELFSELKKYDSDDIFIAGGAMLYHSTLQYCDEALITKVDATANAEYFFPNLDRLPEWSLSDESEPVIDNGYNIKFTRYVNSLPKKPF
ncbi:MAG: dihydrofolate reductase [Christensenellales bacterium]|jgi:dihydrofolate reductase